MGILEILLIAFSVIVIIGGIFAGRIASKKVREMEEAEMNKKKQK